MRPLFFTIAVAFLVISCSNQKDYEQQLTNVFEQEKSIQCELASMKDSIGQKWDAINALLEKNLPAKMPVAEKSNMLRVRNANLIRMFESFDSMPEAIKLALDEVENEDIKMSERINALKKEAQAIESQKLALFEEIGNSEGEQAVLEYKKNHIASPISNCK